MITVIIYFNFIIIIDFNSLKDHYLLITYFLVLNFQELTKIKRGFIFDFIPCFIKVASYFEYSNFLKTCFQTLQIRTKKLRQ